MLEKLTRVTTDILVADQLKKWIVSKDLQAGDRLPTEQYLCEELGVARHTLREGIKRLAQLGVLESRTGSGTYISKVSFDNFAEYMLYLKERKDISNDDISHIRRILEGYSASLCARMATESDISELEQAVEAMEKACEKDNWKAYVECDVAFHAAIAEATKNLLLIGLISAIRNLTVSFMNELDRNSVGISMEVHKKLLEAIKKRDSKSAEAIMDEHISISHKLMKT